MSRFSRRILDDSHEVGRMTFIIYKERDSNGKKTEHTEHSDDAQPIDRCF